MLFNIILVVLTVYALIAPLIMVYCIKFGYRMADNPKKEAEKPVVAKKPQKPANLTKAQEQEIQFLENLMRYDGTSRGQRKIEV